MYGGSRLVSTAIVKFCDDLLFFSEKTWKSLWMPLGLTPMNEVS